MTNFILYDDDYDGFGAAWAAKQAEDQMPNERTVYRPYQHGSELPLDFGALKTTDAVFMFDFCPKAEGLRVLAQRVGHLIVGDHHDSSLASILDFTDERSPDPDFFEHEGRHESGDHECKTHFLWNDGMSAAGVAWDLFFPGRALPALTRYIMARDLWEWTLAPESRIITYAIRSRPRTFEVWDAMNADLEHMLTAREDESTMLVGGQAIKRHVDEKVADLAQHAALMRFNTRDDWMPEVPVIYSSLYQSELGERLLGDHPTAPFAVIVFDTTEGQRVYNLRSQGRADVGRIATTYGGGGHQDAAGFSVNPDAPVLHSV